MTEFHNITMNDIEGNPIAFDRYDGTVCLVVNVASK